MTVAVPGFDSTLLADVCTALGITDLRPVKHGGQKLAATALLGADQVMAKVIQLGAVADPEALKRAERETELLGTIAHRNVVSLRSGLAAVGTPTAIVGWLEEYVEGDDLAARFGPPWPWSEVKAMAIDVGNGLTALHDSGAVHRDLSPGNVRRRSADGSWVVLDPGYARHVLRSTITHLGQPGTPGYLSPEHCNPPARPTWASDVFVLGILMYQALTGVEPIPWTGNAADYTRRLLEEQAPSVRLARPDLTPEQGAVVNRCLQRLLPRRYHRPAALCAALAAV